MTLADVHLSGDDSWPLARLSGQIDLSNADLLGAHLEDAVSNHAQGLVLDLSGVRYLDSAGLRLIFRLSRQLGDRSQRLRLVVPDDSPLNRVLDIAGVRSVVEVSVPQQARPPQRQECP